jgi:hypothetical protein
MGEFDHAKVKSIFGNSHVYGNKMSIKYQVIRKKKGHCLIVSNIISQEHFIKLQKYLHIIDLTIDKSIQMDDSNCNKNMKV